VDKTFRVEYDDAAGAMLDSNTEVLNARFALLVVSEHDLKYESDVPGISVRTDACVEAEEMDGIEVPLGEVLSRICR